MGKVYAADRPRLSSREARPQNILLTRPRAGVHPNLVRDCVIPWFIGETGVPTAEHMSIGTFPHARLHERADEPIDHHAAIYGVAAVPATSALPQHVARVATPLAPALRRPVPAPGWVASPAPASGRAALVP